MNWYNKDLKKPPIATTLARYLRSSIRMDHEVLKKRTALFSLQVSTFTRPLFRSPETADVARQLRRAAHGVASNYRAAGLSRSHREFISRMATVLEESDEAAYWFEHLRDAEVA